MIVSNSNVTQSSFHSLQQSRTSYESLEHQKLAADGTVLSSERKDSDKASLSEAAMKLSKEVASRQGGDVNISHQRSQFMRQGVMQLSAGQTQFVPLTPQGLGGMTLEMGQAEPLPLSFTPTPSLQGSSGSVFPAPAADSYVTLAAMVIESITGKKIELISPENLMNAVNERVSNAVSVVDLSAQQFSLDLSASSEVAFEGMRYHRTDIYQEAERTSFSAKGQIMTTDGKQIDINLMMEMQREFSSSSSTTISAGVQLKDPLILNFGAPSTSLTQEKYSFDLDADGTKEQISFVGSGSGMLMLDKNGDMKANDGSELFGALSGNGFADLSQYDDDGNGFIDEGDAVYSKLKIWVKTDQGNDQYFGLAEKGVDAIYLGAVSTEFSLKDNDNEQHGQVRSTSFFVSENGNSGTVQQIDLVV